MKRIVLSALACLALPLAPCIASVSSPIVGFVTLNLQEGNNFLGFSLLPDLAVQSSFTVNAGDRTHINLTAAGLVLSDDQYNTGAQPTYAVEITSTGASQGFTAAITDTVATGNELVLADAIPADVTDGSTLKVWRLWTLSSVFGATNTAGLTGSTAPETADLVLLPTGATTFDQYFYSTGGAQGTGWRKVGDGTTDHAAQPVSLAQGAAVRARSAKAIIITGLVKPGKTTVSLQTGRNYVANLCPVNAAGTGASAEGRTLGNSGLYTGTASGLTGATASGDADLVLLWNGSGYTQYFYSTGGFTGTGWRLVGSGTTDQANTALPDGAFVILRRGAALNLQLNQGNF
jgi:uncharacterized protein (TIGR02597 family)